MINKYFTFLIFLLLCACAPSRDLVYFKDLKDSGQSSEQIKNRAEPTIQPNDLLSITVSTMNPESNVLFNNGVMQTVGSTTGAVATDRTNDGYLVGEDGTINFPVLGNVKLAGLTKAQATEKMASEIRNSVKKPIVNIRFLNFRVTVIGEVNRPSTYVVPTEHINVVEALGLAGDLTAYGKRENILIIREKGGIRQVTHVNLNKKSILDSPYYSLQQNDIIYVEPAKIKALQGSQTMFYVPLISAGVSILSLLFIIFR